MGDIFVYRFKSKRMEGRLCVYCPACDELHHFNDTWRVTDETTAPTVTPSLLVTTSKGENAEKSICHFYIRKGRIDYLGDCSHKLRGQNFPMPPIPPKFIEEINEWEGGASVKKEK